MNKFLNELHIQMQIDPAGVCRYRSENRALGPPSSPRVVFLGDSITEGWIAAAPALFTHNVLDRGISGQTTSQILLRFRQDAINLHPAVIHILAGVNDMNTPAGTALTKSNLESMVELAKAHRIAVIIGSLTPSSHFWASPDFKPASQILSLNEWLKGFAIQQHVLFVNYHTPLADSQNGLKSELSNDGLHPNQRGYDIMTPIAKQAISTALASPEH